MEINKVYPAQHIARPSNKNTKARISDQSLESANKEYAKERLEREKEEEKPSHDCRPKTRSYSYNDITDKQIIDWTLSIKSRINSI